VCYIFVLAYYYCCNVFMYTLHCKKKFNYYKKQNIFSEKQKGFRDGLSYSTPQKSKETKGNAITQPWSHPIKNVEFRDGMGPRLGNGISPCFFAFLRGGI